MHWQPCLIFLAASKTNRNPEHLYQLNNQLIYTEINLLVKFNYYLTKYQYYEKNPIVHVHCGTAICRLLKK